MLTINYKTFGDKYLLTVKDVTAHKIICMKQELPREYALFGVPVEDLDDPFDVFRTLKKRLETKFREDGHKLPESGLKIDRSFF